MTKTMQGSGRSIFPTPVCHIGIVNRTPGGVVGIDPFGVV